MQKGRQQTHTQGQLFVEVIVALGLVSIGMLSIFGVLARSVSVNRLIADRFTATYLASEGIEIAKNILDANIIKSVAQNQAVAWNAGFANAGDYEIDYRSFALTPKVGQGAPLSFGKPSPNATYEIYGYNLASGAPTPFLRTIHIEPIRNKSGDQIGVKVLSAVHWTSRGGLAFDIAAEDDFYNWRPAGVL